MAALAGDGPARSTTSTSRSARRSRSPAREAAFRAVDFDLVVAIARAARAAGATPARRRLGARRRSPLARLLQPRQGRDGSGRRRRSATQSVVIARPSLLLGDRDALGQPTRARRGLGGAPARAAAAARAGRRAADRGGGGRRGAGRRARPGEPGYARAVVGRRCSGSAAADALSRRRASSCIRTRASWPRDFQAESCWRRSTQVRMSRRVSRSIFWKLRRRSGIDAVAHRAAGLAAVAAVAEAAARRQRRDVGEARDQRALVGVGRSVRSPGVSMMQAPPAADAASAPSSCACRGCRSRAPRRCPGRAAPSSVLVRVDLPAPDEPRTTSVRPKPVTMREPRRAGRIGGVDDDDLDAGPAGAARAAPCARRAAPGRRRRCRPCSGRRSARRRWRSTSDR